MTENLRLQKQNLRARMREIRNQLTDPYKKTADQMIAEQVTGLTEFIQADTIFCFVSTDDEINTRPLLKQVLKSGKRLAVPRCRPGGMMEAYEIKALAQLQPGFYGILEPAGDCREVSREEIDFAIVPCLSCDLRGRRLGHGGGYYDRYMMKRDYPAAVICREQMLCGQIPAEDFDAVMDLVVTEARVVRISKPALQRRSETDAVCRE